MKSKEASPQVAVARKAAALKAAAKNPNLLGALIAANKKAQAQAALAPDVARHQHDQRLVHGARAPPVVHLLDKHDVLAIANVSYVTLWGWMRSGRFPRSRVVGQGQQSKSVWRSDEVQQWLDGLPVRKLKGDDTIEAA